METKERQVQQRQQILTELKAPAIKREITAHVRAYCLERYDDPQTAERDMCKALGGVHCVAIDSPYSHVEQGESICKLFRKLPPLKLSEAIAAPATTAATGSRTCAYCHKPYEPRSNRQQYCNADCASAARKQKEAARKRAARS